LGSTGGGRGFCCRKSIECKGLRRFRIRLLFSIGFLDAADVIAMDASAGCVKIVRRAETAQGTLEGLGGASDEEKHGSSADPGRVHIRTEPFGVLLPTIRGAVLRGWVPGAVARGRAADSDFFAAGQREYNCAERRRACGGGVLTF